MAVEHPKSERTQDTHHMNKFQSTYVLLIKYVARPTRMNNMPLLSGLPLSAPYMPAMHLNTPSNVGGEVDPHPLEPAHSATNLPHTTSYILCHTHSAPAPPTAVKAQ